jgi:hypothetical protein
VQVKQQTNCDTDWNSGKKTGAGCVVVWGTLTENESKGKPAGSPPSKGAEGKGSGVNGSSLGVRGESPTEKSGIGEAEMKSKPVVFS